MHTHVYVYTFNNILLYEFFIIELTKPLNQSKKFLGNPSILEYSVNKGRIESVNSEPKGMYIVFCKCLSILNLIC